MANAITTALGRVQPVYKGNFVYGTEYDYLDNVLFNGSTYVSLVAGNKNTYPTETAYWQIVSQKGDRGIQGYTGSFGTPTATASRLDIGEDPTVAVTASGPDEAKIFSFEFGIPDGAYGFDTVSASASSVSASTPVSASASLIIDGDVRNLSFSFNIPAADGQGAQSVDGISADANNNVELSAVRYVSQDLTETQKSIVRDNINAIANPSKEYGQFLRYAGDVTNPSWVAANILQVPNGGTTGYVVRKQVSGYGWTPTYEIPSGGNTNSILCKLTNSDYEVGWASAISSSDIDSMMVE